MGLRNTHCCGVLEFEGLLDLEPEEIVDAIIERTPGWSSVPYVSAGAVTLMDVWRHGEALNHRKNGRAGLRFKKFIVENNLGTVHNTPWFPNPHHQGRHPHDIRIYTWVVNVRGFEAYAKTRAVWRTRRAW